MVDKPLGIGRKHPQKDIDINKLFLDSENPRLPEEAQGKDEFSLLKTLYKYFSLNTLADSMANNGYFDEEPLVAIPKDLPEKLQNIPVESSDFIDFLNNPNIEYVVVEGNRRLATAKLLLNENLRDLLNITNWPMISQKVRNDLSNLPVIIYQKRIEVIPYLGVRHIVGIQKWESYAKARYIAKMIESGFSLEEIGNQIGDQSGALIRNYVSYKIVEQAKDQLDFNIKEAKNDFSYLLLAVGQGNIKNYLGLPQKIQNSDINSPIPKEKMGNLKKFLTWIYGNEKIRPAIHESRDITNYLSDIVSSDEAIAYLESTNNIVEAYDRSDGEEKMVLKYLRESNRKIETVLSFIHRHKTSDVVAEIERIKGNILALEKSVEDYL
ncbi:MAG: hypothetical protein C0410_03705 [Anaerolinea sp.]|nr:hypothetical protein [Anaerolinea sp.]